MDLLIIPRDTDSFSDIDSGIIIYNEKSKLSVTNLNDFGFSKTFMKKFQNQIKSKKLININYTIICLQVHGLIHIIIAVNQIKN